MTEKRSTPAQIGRMLEFVRSMLVMLNLSKEGMQRIIDSRRFADGFRELALSLANEYFVLLTDEEAFAWLKKHGRKSLADARRIVDGWRKQARLRGVADAVRLHALVHAGATFKRDIPKMGPCWEDFTYLQNWDFLDTATEACLVSWVPVPLANSTSKNVDGQRAVVEGFKIEANLPSWYELSFGSLVHLGGMALAHHKATGLDPFGGLIVRSNVSSAGGCRLDLNWNQGRLYCGNWRWDVDPYSNVAVFAMMVL